MGSGHGDLAEECVPLDLGRLDITSDNISLENLADELDAMGDDPLLSVLDKGAVLDRFLTTFESATFD